MAKIKMKTRKAIVSRFKVTAKGRLKFSRQGRRHLLTKKSSNRKRRLKKSAILPIAKEKTYKKLIAASS